MFLELDALFGDDFCVSSTFTSSRELDVLRGDKWSLSSTSRRERLGLVGDISIAPTSRLVLALFLGRRIELSPAVTSFRALLAFWGEESLSTTRSRRREFFSTLSFRTLFSRFGDGGGDEWAIMRLVCWNCFCCTGNSCDVATNGADDGNTTDDD